MAKITIDLDLTAEGLYENEDGEFELQDPIRDQIVSTIVSRVLDRELEKTISGRVNAAVNEKLGQIVDGLIAKPIQETDWMGNPKGEAMTVQSMFADILKDWILKPAYDGDRYSRKASGLGGHMRGWVETEVKRHLKTFLDNANHQIAKEVQNKALEATAELFQKAVERR